MEFEEFYSTQSLELAVWAHVENNRVKASKLIRMAHRLEEKYRKKHALGIATSTRGPVLLKVALACQNMRPPRGGSSQSPPLSPLLPPMREFRESQNPNSGWDYTDFLLS